MVTTIEYPEAELLRALEVYLDQLEGNPDVLECEARILAEILLLILVLEGLPGGALN